MCIGGDAQILAGMGRMARRGERKLPALEPAPTSAPQVNTSVEEQMHDQQRPAHTQGTPGTRRASAGPSPWRHAPRLRARLARRRPSSSRSPPSRRSPRARRAPRPRRTYFVAPHGSDALACCGQLGGSPFKTIQHAIACTVNGDTVSLAPSGKTPYPGIGAVADSVTIEAEAGANARDVEIAAGSADLEVQPGASVTVSGVTLTCLGGECKETIKEATVGSPAVVNAGTLTLSADTITDDVNAHTAAIENIPPEGSSTPATLNVIDSTVSGNGGGAFGGGIASREVEREGKRSTGALSVNVVNSTIAENEAAGKGARPRARKAHHCEHRRLDDHRQLRAPSGGGLFVESGATRHDRQHDHRRQQRSKAARSPTATRAEPMNSRAFRMGPAVTT